MADSFNYKTQRLISMAKGGDESALDRLCRIYGERVRRIVRLRMGRELRSKMESMDLVQDAFISALRGLENFTYKNEGDFLRWMASIAENRIRDNLEKFHTGKRDIHKEIPLNNNRQAGQDSFVKITGPVDLTTPSVIMSRQEDLDKLEKAMDKLNPEYRKVIDLAKIKGLSHKEIAERLNKNPHSTRSLLSRALTALTQAYEEI